ncbi:MAG: hypothetical protein F6K10_20875 [Moorea sp. SIO2B7]|nr:hypothetical protein [Moorena sp. SIO2B7]
MNLDQQIKILIDNAPQDGVTPTVIEQAVSPVVKLFANQLQHLEYYVLQTLDQGWVLTTLSNRAKPNLEKKVIYAFATLKDAGNFQGSSDPQIMTTSLPVTHVLFQLFALKQVYSIVFMETPGNLTAGVEVKRADLENLIETQLQQLRTSPKSSPSNIPSNIA